MRVTNGESHWPYAPVFDAGWSSPVARQAHNLKAAGSNPAPATNFTVVHRDGASSFFQGFRSNCSGCEDCLSHAVDDFFVRRANCGEDAAEIGPCRIAIAGDKIIRTEPHAARHRDDVVFSKVE